MLIELNAVIDSSGRQDRDYRVLYLCVLTGGCYLEQ